MLLITLQPQYKESSVYMVKFKSCLARALSLIKTHVMNILQNATQNVMPKKVMDICLLIYDSKDDGCLSILTIDNYGAYCSWYELLLTADCFD